MLVTLTLIAWSVLTAWVAVDAERRGRNWLAWAVLVAATSLIGLLIWLIVRRRSAESRPLIFRLGSALALSVLGLLAGVVILRIFVLGFVFQVVRVEGLAMAPTLNDQDRLLVNKLTYEGREPRRNEIVMLYYPLNPTKQFVKRVVAEEGDKVRIIGGNVSVNGILLDEPFVPSEFKSHDDWGPQVVPQGYYFVMGDHRNNSSDSRHWGYVPKKYIVGRIQCRWWPVSQARCF